MSEIRDRIEAIEAFRVTVPDPGPCPSGCLSMTDGRADGHPWEGYDPDTGEAHRIHEFYRQLSVSASQEEFWSAATGTSVLLPAVVNVMDVDEEFHPDDASAFAASIVEAVDKARERDVRQA